MKTLTLLFTALAVCGGAASAAGYRSIAAGSAHTCVLSASGAAYCWGQNAVGQFGNGTTADSAVPVPAAGNLRFLTLGAGGGTTCGIALDGKAYCWGDGTYGQLGSVAPTACGATPCALSPVPVIGGLTFTKISTGPTHSCAVTAAAAAYCWGDAGSGELGQGNYAGPNVCAGRPCSLTPIPVQGALQFSKINAGSGTTCAIATPSQALYCWGDGQFDQIPSGMPQQSQTLPTVAAGAGLKFTSVAIGAYAACGGLSKDNVRCWGGSIDGALGASIIPEFCATAGLGTFACSSKAIEVDGNLTADADDRAVSMSRTGVCAIEKNGKASCWGLGINGQLGNGSSPAQAWTPQAVAGSFKFVELAVGGDKACGVTHQGSVACWGAGSSNVPVAVSLP